MIERTVLNSLREWSKKQNRKPLVIRGARQVGKTTIVEIFAKEFDTFLALNLDREAERDLFDLYQSAGEVLTAIHLLKNEPKKDGRTLLFIDEIQSSPKAVALLRYFYEDMPELYVIAAGSLLETMIDRQISFPVGRVEYLALRPCSFGEFLNAMGEFQLQNALQTVSLPAPIHAHAMKLFNEYVLVGGMPEAVAFYAKTKDLVALRDVYETLLNSYRDDMEKYASDTTIKNVLRHILMYGWQYAGQRIKFERFANSNYKSREMGEAFRILEKAMLLELTYPVVNTSLPLLPDLKKSPKLMWLDTGLVNYSAKLQQELFGTQDISEAWKGKIAEHIVGQCLLSASDLVSEKRNFWVREARNSQAEVDFVFPYKGQLVPVEVKSGDNSKLKSLHLFMEKSTGTFAIRFWNQAVSLDEIKLPSGKKYTLYNLPFYYSGYIEKVLELKNGRTINHL